MVEESRLCIYCREEKAISLFNKEHVIARAWGAFKSSPTLVCVCARCNNDFGNTFELDTARGSYEALLRYEEGVAHEVHNLRYDRVALTPAEPSPYAGILLRLMVQEDGRSLVGLHPQVCFKDEGQTRWTSFSIPYLRKMNFAPDLVPAFVRARKGASLLLGETDHDVADARAAFVQLGVRFEEGALPTPLPKLGEEVEVALRTTFDSAVRRTIAKLAFNYLAWQMGAEFVLSDDFDGIRRFIRSGEGAGSRFVRVSNKPLLAEETDEIRFYAGHLVAVDWAERWRSIVGQVALFNTTTYDVRLTMNYHGLYRSDLSSGSWFDFESGRIEPLFGTKLTVPPSPLWSLSGSRYAGRDPARRR